MMGFMSGGNSLLDALAPKLEVGQQALYDALKTRDASRAKRIIKRVAGSRGGGGNERRTAAGGSGGPKVEEVRIRRKHNYVVTIFIPAMQPSPQSHSLP